MPRIDAHIHAFPDRLATAVRERLNLNGALAGSPFLEGVAESVKENGFDGAWVLPYAHRPGIAESINEWSASAIPAFPGLIAGATFHPGDDDLARLVRRALVDLRLRVVKLHCSVGSFDPSDPRLGPLWQTAAETGAPIVVHAGQVAPGDTEAGEIDALIPVLAANPRTRIVLAHAGHPATSRAIELMDRFENLYADLTPVWDRPVTAGAETIRRFPGRFLFGSDAPNNPVPAATQVGRLDGLGLSADEVEALLGGAAAALIPFD